MPKTIAITPSWYWPAGVPRVAGVPPFGVHEMLVERRARLRPDEPAVVSGSLRLTGAELAEQVTTAASALAGRVEPGSQAVLSAGASVEGVVLLLAALAAGLPLRLHGGSDDAGVGAFGAAVGLADDHGAGALASTGLPVVRLADLTTAGGAPRPLSQREPALALAAGTETVWHSHRGILGGAISLQTFLQAGPERPWLSTFPLSSWQGLYGITAPLMAGATLVLAEPGEAPLDAIVREGVGYAFMDLDAAFTLTRESKRDVKSVRGVLTALLLSVDGPFDSDQRRRVGRLFEAPALTVYGRPETGPIFASHPSWYLDEAVGIPLSNAHVVPVDPRSGNPIPTLWELVESAMVTVWSPMLTVGYEGDPHPERFRDGRFLTGVIASSDANGMIYILPD